MSETIPTEFLESNRAFLIAPAGYGKTFTIVSCVKRLLCEKPILILTHTHAGVAALKAKMSKQGVERDKYKIDTISSFIQRYVLSFFKQSEIGPQEDTRNYFPNVLDKSIILFQKPTIKRIFIESYSHLFVDEYQDCTKRQHELIEIFATYIPTHLFGDPLQGIFDFEGNPSVKFPSDFENFQTFYFLTTPYRWTVNGNSVALGEKIKEYRELLEEGDSVQIESDIESNFEVVCHNPITPANEQVVLYNQLHKKIKQLNTESILVIMPSFMQQNRRRGLIEERANILRRFDIEHQFNLVEAIDDRAYYQCAHNIDSLIDEIVASSLSVDYLKIREKFEEVTFDSQSLNMWFNSSGLISKRDADEKVFSDKLKLCCDKFFQDACARSFQELLLFFYQNNRRNIKRPDLARQVLKSLEYAVENNTSVYEAMVKTKNHIRRNGRKIYGKCFGTTLLTKGLEFDAVILLYANKIEDKRNFYVAISRACKNLIIFTESNQLSFRK